MFSGIIESCEKLLSRFDGSAGVRIRVQRPAQFTDVKIGDSICTNGVCLTIEDFTDSELGFALGAETLRVLGEHSSYFQKPFNLERSLAFGSRIHGHFVSGHVDATTELVDRSPIGESLDLTFRLPPDAQDLIWPKGSATIHGVSLTVNDVSDSTFSVCLIPETLKRTNLGEFSVGDRLCLEYDWMAKAFQRQFRNMMHHQQKKLNRE